MTRAETITAWGIPVRVFSPEYVIALKLASFRSKDRVHIAHLLRTAQREVDIPGLEAILSRHGLLPRWRQVLGEVQG
ncbi:MAG: hypothetical protein HYZ28_08750 [Myxococcales bacterium]|nr:hypothetical protein [Myxococcales bacterium]